MTAGRPPRYSAAMSNPTVRVEDLTKSYGDGPSRLDVLRCVDLNVSEGEAVALTGPSGCGKSTLLSIIGTLEEPDTGRVLFGGEEPFLIPERKRNRFRSETVGFVFQDHHLLPQCTVRENVLLPIVATRSADDTDVARADALLDSVGLADRVEHRPAELSGGERQRAAFCRALINSPRLLLADEPTGNLDPATAESVGSLLLDLGRREGTAVLCVTHSLALAERFPRHVRLRDGRIDDDAAGERS